VCLLKHARPLAAAEAGCEVTAARFFSSSVMVHVQADCLTKICLDRFEFLYFRPGY
jgi:hypothetical protein